jgi:serine/threonine-protein kinase
MPEPGYVVAQRYRLDSILSSGGMGSVYVASHVQTGRRFAVKLMLADLTGDEEAERRFLREARLASSINHPCVIKVYDVGYHEQHPYMVMELLEGESLGQRLKRGRMTPHEAATLMQRIVEGVGAAHKLGIVHRDLKPDNVFLCRAPDGRSVEPKVLDFGISKSLAANGTQNLTKTGIALGTPLYMSMEQIQGQRDVDQRADVYSLGVMLYEMACGQVPYNGRNYAELVLKIITGDAPPLRSVEPSVPAALEGVVMRAMAIDRTQRYPNVDAFAHDLRAFAQGMPLLAAVPRVSNAARGPVSRTPFTTEALRRSEVTTPDEPLVLPKRRANVLAMAALAGAVLATGAFLLTRGGAPQAAVTSPNVVQAASPSAPAVTPHAPIAAPPPAAPALATPTPAPAPSPSPAPLAATPQATPPPSAAVDELPHARATRAITHGQAAPSPAAPVVTIRPVSEPAARPQPKRESPSANERYQIRDEKLIDPF